MRRPKTTEPRRGQRHKQHTPVQSRTKYSKSRSVSKTNLFAQVRQKLKVNRKSVANVGSLTAGAMGIALAELVGVGELVIGAVVAYATYRVIRYRVAPTEALMEGMELEHGEVRRRTSNAA